MCRGNGVQRQPNQAAKPDPMQDDEHASKQMKASAVGSLRFGQVWITLGMVR